MYGREVFVHNCSYFCIYYVGCAEFRSKILLTILIQQFSIMTVQNLYLNISLHKYV